MEEAERYEIIIPTEIDLEVNDSVACPFDGCNRIFKSSASRTMHIVRHHEGKDLASVASSNHVKRTKLYYCPVSGCPRSRGIDTRPFKKLGQVKQHYLSIHKEKKYCCEKCGKKFGMGDAYRRHVNECGAIFTCKSCDLELKSYNALYQHCKRTRHPFQERKKIPSTSSSKSRPCVIIAPLIIKSVLPLQRNISRPPITSNNATMTTAELEPSPSQDETLQSVELATQTELTGFEFLTPAHDDSLHLLQDKDAQTNPLALCEFGTQTMPLLSDPWPHPFRGDISDLFDTETMDFGTQTLDTTGLTPYSSQEDLTYNFTTKDQSSQT